MPIVLGFQPFEIEVVLARDSGFETAIVGDDDWPENIQVELRFTTGPNATAIVWPADVVGDALLWHVPAADVAEVVDAKATNVRLIYRTADNQTLLWARGRTRVA